MTTYEILNRAIADVLARKRSERLELQQKYDAGCKEKGGPMKGLASELQTISAHIKILDYAAEELLQCQRSQKLSEGPPEPPLPPNVVNLKKD